MGNVKSLGDVKFRKVSSFKPTDLSFAEELDNKLKELQFKTELDQTDLDLIQMSLIDPQLHMANVLIRLEELYRAEKIDEDNYIKLKLQAHKVHYGDKVQINQKTLNLHAKLPQDKVDEILEFLDGDTENDNS